MLQEGETTFSRHSFRCGYTDLHQVTGHPAIRLVIVHTPFVSSLKFIASLPMEKPDKILDLHFQWEVILLLGGRAIWIPGVVLSDQEVAKHRWIFSLAKVSSV